MSGTNLVELTGNHMNRTKNGRIDYDLKSHLKRGNPDPCIYRRREDYYIAESSFEWFPGILVYHSKDLKN